MGQILIHLFPMLKVITVASLSTMHAVGVLKIGIIVVVARRLVCFQLLVHWRDSRIKKSF